MSNVKRLTWAFKKDKHGQSYQMLLYFGLFPQFFVENASRPHVYSFPASGNSCCQLKTLANSLDPDQDRQNVGPDLDLNCLTL